MSESNNYSRNNQTGTENFIYNYCGIAAYVEENAVDRENVDLNDENEDVNEDDDESVDEDIGQGKSSHSSDEEEDVVDRVTKQNLVEQQAIPEQLIMPRVNASTTIPVAAAPLVVDVPIVSTPLPIDVPHAATQTTQTTIEGSNQLPLFVRGGKRYVTLPNIKKAIATAVKDKGPKKITKLT